MTDKYRGPTGKVVEEGIEGAVVRLRRMLRDVCSKFDVVQYMQSQQGGGIDYAILNATPQTGWGEVAEKIRTLSSEGVLGYSVLNQNGARVRLDSYEIDVMRVVCEKERRAQGMKRCSACKVKLPVGDFSRNECKQDGLDNVCKVCKGQYARKRRRVHKAVSTINEELLLLAEILEDGVQKSFDNPYLHAAIHQLELYFETLEGGSSDG